MQRSWFDTAKRQSRMASDSPPPSYDDVVAVSPPFFRASDRSATEDHRSDDVIGGQRRASQQANACSRANSARNGVSDNDPSPTDNRRSSEFAELCRPLTSDEVRRIARHAAQRSRGLKSLLDGDFVVENVAGSYVATRTDTLEWERTTMCRKEQPHRGESSQELSRKQDKLNTQVTTNPRILSCSDCSGRGVVMCKDCSGSGTIICWSCHGNGRTMQSSSSRCDTCQICSGCGSESCRHCYRAATRNCERCQGCGRVVHFHHICKQLMQETQRVHEFQPVEFPEKVLKSCSGRRIEIRITTERPVSTLSPAIDNSNKHSYKFLRKIEELEIIPVNEVVCRTGNNRMQFWIVGNENHLYVPELALKKYKNCFII